MSEGAQDYVRRRGGVVYVSAHPHRCCTGPLTLLEASTDGPRVTGATGVADAAQMVELVELVSVGGIDVRWAGGNDQPARLDIDLRGRLWPRLVASWNGCAYKL